MVRLRPPLVSSPPQNHRKHLMKRFSHLIPVVAFFLGGTAISLWVGSEHANAQGCCFGSQRPPAYPVGPPVPINPTAPAGTAMNSYYGSYGTLPPSPGTLFPAGLPQTTASFLPTAAYDTRWMQTPVTYYRPVTQFDPNYGTTVTSLQPCTSYQYQAARVPLVSPRMIGDYSYSANRWPVAATPGYYPNNVVPTMQQLPAVGTPVTSGMMGYSSTGTSSGPASTLPLATMSSPVGGVVTANHMAPMGLVPMGAAPIGSSQYSAMPATAWMPATAAPISQVPITSAIPGTGTPIYTVPATAPTTSLVPANTMNPCPNGVCAPGSVPSIPGATSVVPMGPPTLMTPANNGSAVMSNAPNVANPILPNAGDIKPIMPPTSGADPEATRQPTLGSSASTFPLKRVPVSEFDRAATSIQEESRARVVIPQTLTPSAVAPSNPSPNVLSPSVLSPSNTLQPLKAPSELDAKPRWNPKLLPPSKGDSDETVASTSMRFCVTV